MVVIYYITDKKISVENFLPKKRWGEQIANIITVIYSEYIQAVAPLTE